MTKKSSKNAKTTPEERALAHQANVNEARARFIIDKMLVETEKELKRKINNNKS